MLALLREFLPLMRQVLVSLLHRRIAIGVPLAFVGASAELFKSVAVNCQTAIAPALPCGPPSSRSSCGGPCGKTTLDLG